MKIAANLIAMQSHLEQDSAQTSNASVKRNRNKKQNNQLKSIQKQREAVAVQADGDKEAAIIGANAAATSAASGTVIAIAGAAAGASAIPVAGWVVAAILGTIAIAMFAYAAYQKSETTEEVGGLQADKTEFDQRAEIDQQQIDDAKSREEEKRTAAKQNFQEAIRMQQQLIKSQSAEG